MNPHPPVAAVKLSQATYDNIGADLAHLRTLIPTIAEFHLDEQVPHLELWAVDADGQVLYRQRWRDGQLIGVGP